MIGHLWQAMWPNIFAPSAFTLAGLGAHHARVRVMARREHQQRLAQAERHHAELQAQALAHHNELKHQAARHQDELVALANAHHEALKAHLTATMRLPVKPPRKPAGGASG